VVYGLRPPALDERGLVQAIRDHVAGLDGSSAAPGRLQIEVESLPAELPPLPAAVEVAAYRIALEALTNVVRHAHARHAAIRFRLETGKRNTFLRVEVSDDGLGFPGSLRAGVGLRSMRERADELGGTLAIEPAQGGGTGVCARLPLDGEA
jgi:signal transduction histidine kinase